MIYFEKLIFRSKGNFKWRKRLGISVRTYIEIDLVTIRSLSCANDMVVAEGTSVGKIGVFFICKDEKPF